MTLSCGIGFAIYPGGGSYMRTQTLAIRTLAVMLLLGCGGDNPVAIDPAEQVELLTSREWKLQAMRSLCFAGPLKGTVVTLQVGVEDSTLLVGFAGCNWYGATYVVDGGRLSVGPIAETQRLCGDAGGIMRQESLYLFTLGVADSYRVQHDELVLYDVGGSPILVYSSR